MADTKLNLKQVLLTAAITCIFTVIAGVITYVVTTDRPELTYSIASGPTLSFQGTHKRIFAIEIVNLGRREIADATATIDIKAGKIEEVAYDASPGLALVPDRQSTSYGLRAGTLNPGERFSISVLATIPSPEFVPVIGVRGRGTTGTMKKISAREGKAVVYLAVGSMATMLGAVTSLSPTFRRILGNSPSSAVARAFMRSASAVGPFERNELVAYILGSCGLKELSLMVRFAPSETSFRGAADCIVSQSIGARDEERQKSVTALKCMLLVKRINSDSVDVIAAALRQLGGVSEDEINALRENAVDEDMAPVQFREQIVSLAQQADGVGHKQIES